MTTKKTGLLLVRPMVKYTKEYKFIRYLDETLTYLDVTLYTHLGFCW